MIIKINKKVKNENYLSATYFGIICLFFMVCLVILGGVSQSKQAILIRPEVVVEAQEKPDQRADQLKRFFLKHNSPLADHSETFIEVADLYQIDWTLLPAIASQESGFGKRTPSCALYNPFGWTSTTSPCGFYRFESFDDAIRHVAQKINNLSCYARFRETGDLFELAKKYNSVSTNEWIKKISFFQEKIKNESR
jgi:hypothetical protein